MLFTDKILETNSDLNIIFIQELPWSVIYTILSLTSKERDRVVGVPVIINTLRMQYRE